MALSAKKGVSVIALAITHAAFDTLYFCFNDVLQRSTAYIEYNLFYLVFASFIFYFSIKQTNWKSLSLQERRPN